MKTFFRNAMGKKLITTLLVLVMATCAVFAASITVKGEVGDAKIYDNNYKIVENPSQISTGYVVQTAENGIAFANDSFIIQVEPNSLVQIMSLGGTPEIYLLDGKAAAASTKSFRVRTTVTYYSAEANSEIYVISDEAEESAFVSAGSASATNLITGKKTTVPEGTYINNAKGDSTPSAIDAAAYWSNESETAESTEQAATEQPAAEQPAAEQPATEQAPVEVVVIPAPLSRTFTYAGYSATITAYIGEAHVTYPAFVTNEEINAAAAAASWKYPEYVQGITYEFTEPGALTIYYPETYGETEFNLAMGILEKELPAYLNELFQTEAEFTVEAPEPVVIVVEAPAEEPVAEEPVAEEPAPAEETLGALTHTFTYGQFSATLEAYIGTAFLTYPDFVRDDEIDAAAYAASMAYPEDVKGIYYEITEPGKATITYPETYGKLEFDYAVALIEKELPGYIASLFATEPEPEAVVAEEPAPEAPAEPAPAEPAPAAEPEKTPIETTPRPEPQEVEPEPEKESNFRFGATIGVIYGLDHPSSSYKAFLHDRIGGFGKNLEVYVDPTIYYNNLTFGLHFVVDMSLFRPTQIVNPFTFNANGVTEVVNSIMKYIGVFAYEAGDFSIRADRTTELEFRNPVYDSMKRAYDTEDKLLGTVSYTAGNFSANAFVDDLQFQAKLEGRGQYAGLRAAYNLGKVEIGASAIVDMRSGIKSMNFYPAVDIVAPFTFQDTTIEVDAGFAAQLTTSGLQGMLVEGKVNVTYGILTVGVGAAYNKDHHFNDLVNNGPADVIKQFSGNSIDILLSGAINTKYLRVSGSIDAPFALDGGSRLAYNTVITKNGKTEVISADTLNAQADVMLGKFTFSVGAVYNGFCGRLANLLKAIKHASGRRAALAGFVDPEISTYYGIADIKLGNFDAYVRADLARVNGTMTIPVSIGASFSF